LKYACIHRIKAKPSPNWFSGTGQTRKLQLWRLE
jgi:hypothetical protein